MVVTGTGGPSTVIVPVMSVTLFSCTVTLPGPEFDGDIQIV